MSLESPAPAGRATRTAVIAVIPAADPVVGAHRSRLDQAASWGVPAHVTVLYPFVPPAAIDDQVLNRLDMAVASVPAFDCRFAQTGWFGRDVLWLEPDPAEPFRRLTQAMWAAFPSYPPYAGAHDGSAPHLTVAERAQAERAGAADVLPAVEAQVTAGLPIYQRVEELLLISGSSEPGSWRTVRRLPLS